MKKNLLIILYVILSFFLLSCLSTKTYDDLYLEYSNYIESNVVSYQEHIDYINQLSQETIQSVVLVKKIVNFGLGSGIGSGVIFHQDESFYYVLTNHHVVHFEKQTPYQKVTYEIVDFQGDAYITTFVDSDPSYDLGVLKFRKQTKVLPIAQIKQNNPEINDELSIIGYPGFQKNAITLGKITGYSNVEIENPTDSSVSIDFDVIVTNAPVNSGSSGSPLFNINHELIGIVYAGNFTASDTYSRNTFAIPIEKVFEFLNSIGLSLGGQTS